MGITARFQTWNHTHQSFLLLVARIVLGVILLVKGLFFISHAQQLKEMILDSRFSAGVSFWAAYVTFAHLFGGVFIILGLGTRLAATLQVPVLFGALFFILPQQGAGTGSELALTILVSVLLILVLVRGSGELSMEDYLKKHLL